ncbi:MAG: diguanylate cyclase domain-containing protein [Betaproteobacteria bacterium]
MAIDAAALTRTRSGLLFLRAALWIGIVTTVATLAAIGWFNAKTESIVAEGQRRIAVLLAQGLANAVENPLITRDYSDLEERLRQSVAHEQVRSALVVDTAGKVLSHVRQTDGGRPVALFEPERVVLPASSGVFEAREGGAPTTAGFVYWLRIEAARPLGWLRLELVPSATDDTLRRTRFQLNAIFVTAGVTFLVLMTLILYRTYSSVARRELRLLNKQKALEEVAYRDGLTSIPNRHLLMQRLEAGVAESARRGNPLAVCFIDLDGFKQVNDTHGHDAGDRLLAEIAHRLQACLRQGDFVARHGGDEFVVLLSGVTRSPEGDEVLRRMLNAIGQPCTSVPGVIVGASIGVAICPIHAQDPASLLAQADRAMYAAKRVGRNRWHYAESSD